MAAARRLRERAAGRDGRRHTGAGGGVLRHQGRAGVRVGRRRRQLGAHRPCPSRRAVGRGPDAAMIRVVLPPHLRTLAQVKGEVQLEVPGRVTRGAVLDALEARYPMLRGTIRDHVTERRRPFLRFFACERDLTHDPPDAPLEPTAAATSVRVRQGKRVVTDGPFAETKEQLGGYFLIDASDLDEAITIAARIPMASRGTIEVRPVVHIPDLPAD